MINCLFIVVKLNKFYMHFFFSRIYSLLINFIFVTQLADKYKL